MAKPDKTRRLRRIQELVIEIQRENKKLSVQNIRLREEVNRLGGVKTRLELDFRKFKAMSRRQEHIRQRLERSLKKIDKVLELV